MNKNKDSKNKKCLHCGGSGIIKFIPIEFAMYSWQKWQERDCHCKSEKKNDR